MSGKSFLALMVALIAALLIGIAFTSCNTAKKDFDGVNKAILRHPVQTAKQLSDKWPCVPIATTTDSTLYKKYLQDLNDLNDYYKEHQPETIPMEADTVIKTWEDSSKIKYYKKQSESKDLKIKALNAQMIDVMRLCEDKPPLHDTVKVDGPKLFIITQQLSDSEGRNIVLQKKLNGKQDWLNIWRIIALILIGYTGLRIYLKSKLKILP